MHELHPLRPYGISGVHSCFCIGLLVHMQNVPGKLNLPRARRVSDEHVASAAVQMAMADCITVRYTVLTEQHSRVPYLGAMSDAAGGGCWWWLRRA